MSRRVPCDAAYRQPHHTRRAAVPHDEAEPLTGQKSISYKTPHSIDRGVFAKTNVRAFEEAHAILICNGLRGSIHISRL